MALGGHSCSISAFLGVAFLRLRIGRGCAANFSSMVEFENGVGKAFHILRPGRESLRYLDITWDVNDNT